MIEALVHILIVLVILGIVWWIVTMILDQLPIAAPFRQAVNVILLLIGLLIVLSALLPLAGVRVF